MLFPLIISLCLSQSAPNLHARMNPSPSRSRPAAEIKFRTLQYGTPPLVRLYFDATLRNSAGEPRWFLLPSNLSPTAGSIGEKGGVDVLEVYAPSGKGHVVIGRFLGTGGFQALLLPAGAEVRLHQLPISYWGDLPDNVQIEVVTAKRLTIGGEAAETWFADNPISSRKADVAERPGSPTPSLGSKHATHDREVAVGIEEASRTKLTVRLSR